MVDITYTVISTREESRVWNFLLSNLSLPAAESGCWSTGKLFERRKLTFKSSGDSWDISCFGKKEITPVRLGEINKYKYETKKILNRIKMMIKRIKLKNTFIIIYIF